jgi:hypothetical protein
LARTYTVRKVCKIIGFKTKESTAHDKIFTLAGCFIKDTGVEVFSNKVKMYSFSLIFPQKTMKFFLCKNEEKEGWLKSIKDAIGYSSLYDYYTIEVNPFLIFLENLRKRKVWCSLQCHSHSQE